MEGAEILAVSKSTELAILLRRDRQSNVGVLARVPMAGGSPREVSEGVLAADWSPDGQNLAIVRNEKGKYRIEYPIGAVKYESTHALQYVKVEVEELPAVLTMEGALEQNAIFKSIALLETRNCKLGHIDEDMRTRSLRAAGSYIVPDVNSTSYIHTYRIVVAYKQPANPASPQPSANADSLTRAALMPMQVAAN